MINKKKKEKTTRRNENSRVGRSRVKPVKERLAISSACCFNFGAVVLLLSRRHLQARVSCRPLVYLDLLEFEQQQQPLVSPPDAGHDLCLGVKQTAVLNWPKFLARDELCTSQLGEIVNSRVLLDNER